jgi:uncharacterized protein (TIGR02246 family)
MRFLVLAAIALTPAVVHSQQKQQKPPAIQDDRFVRDLHDKNIDDVLELYTPKAVFITPEGKTFKGTEELRKLYEQVTGNYDSDIHLKTTRLLQSTSVVIEHGTYTETLRNRATGISQEIHGTYVFLHERQSDGTWLIAHQKWTGPALH